MDVYGITEFKGKKIGGKIKMLPTDFIVEEIAENGFKCKINTNFIETIKDMLPKTKNEHLHFTLVKKNYTTQRAVNTIARRLRVSKGRFGYAGTKDKRAVTAQRISIWNQEIKTLKKIKLKDLRLKNFKYEKERLVLGDLTGNNFKIIIREIDLSEKEIKEVLEGFKERTAEGAPNYFGHQRFGRVRPINHLVGKQLLLGNFEGAVMIILAAAGNENEENKKARQFAGEHWGKWNEILKQWPRMLGIEAAILNYLVKYPTDYANAFRKLPKKLRRMFIHAFQSYLFNKVLTELLENDSEIPERIPLVGYETDLTTKTGKIIERLLKDEQVKQEHFRLNRMPELSEPGSSRKTKIKTNDFQILNIKKDTAAISFSLEKGAYATIITRMLGVEE